jgi:hypothetical protein
MRATRRHARIFKGIAIILALPLLAAPLVFTPFHTSGASNTSNPNLYKPSAPNIDVNATAAAVRHITSAQSTALNQFKETYGAQATVRWNPFAGTPDVIKDFHTAPSNDTPENVARNFVALNSTLFGVDPSALVLVDQKQALGGYLVKFKQRAGGVDVLNAGLGFVMSDRKQIRMVLGSTFRDVTIMASPALTATAATAAAQSALAPHAINRTPQADQLLKPAFDELERQIAPALRAPSLNVFPTANGFKLSWNVLTFSRNPFGVFITQIDAANGQVLARESKIHYQNPELPYTADIYPNHPTMANPDTGELKLDANGQPEGLLRVQLRNFNPGTNLTGVNGTLAGPHALVRNVLATQQPFPQATLGTFHFRQNNAPLEAQPNEADDLAEPAEHIDDVNIFFFINYLVEYVLDIHRRADTVHSRLGQGDFPDDFPSSNQPLVGLPHFPNDNGAQFGGPIDTSSPDAIIHSTLGLDNAFSIPLSQTIETPNGPQTIPIAPTVYGHGYLFNDLGKDGAVAYHEGMHSISTLIAGLEGAIEGRALNEAQADLWAYTITEAEAIGEYVVKGARARQSVRDGQLFPNQTGGDPDRLAWIRSVHSTLKFSEIGTRNGSAFEEHHDGEIYVATMWDLRHLLKAIEPQVRFQRPAFLDGTPTRQITQGQETWERLHLGSLYILGLTSPDTFIKARDAVIETDRILYSTDPSDFDAPGQHEALIWQVFASHEMGINADSVIGGRQTISTKIPQFAAEQSHVDAPQGVVVEPASATSLSVSWQPVNGAIGYEVFKRRVGTAGQRQFAGVPAHQYFDGDIGITGWSHVSYVLAPDTQYEDKGPIADFFAPAGIRSTADANGFNEMLETEYAVRAISVNPNRQVGMSNLSGGTAVNMLHTDITNAIRTAIANPQMAGGIFEFDQTLTNNGVSSVDGIAYGPITFRIVNISDPTVTVKNADNGGDGRTQPATFVYSQSLANGATSAARHLQFNDPQSRLFTFDAVITARLRTAATAVNGSQPGDGVGVGLPQGEQRSTTETINGTVVVGSGGLGLVDGVDYADVPFVAQENTYGVDGTLSASPSQGSYPDLDFQLRDSEGNVINTSGNFGPREMVSGAIVPGRTYVYRVVGFVNGPTQFQIVSKQYFMPGTTGAGGSGSSSFMPQTQGVMTVRKVRFAVNPLTKLVTVRLLN